MTELKRISNVILDERAKNIVGSPYGSVRENVEWVAQAQLEKAKEDLKLYLLSLPHTQDNNKQVVVHIPLSDWNDLIA